MKTTSCKCGCGEAVRGKRVFVDKEHQLAWMTAGGAKEMNALMPDEARVLGGRVSGLMAVNSGRLLAASEKGGARSREIAGEFKRKHEHPTTRPDL